MSQTLRRPLPLFIMSLLSTLVLLDYFIAAPQLAAASTLLSRWATLIAAFLLVAGIINVLYHNYRTIKKREAKKWYFSVWTILVMFAMLIYGFAVGGAYTPAFEWYWFHLSAWAYTATCGIQSIYQVSASYRAFRARSAEAIVLLVTTFIIVLAFAPLTAAAFPALQAFGTWLSANPAAAVNRGITIGTGVGALALGFRVLLGREKQLG